ncbi:MAG: isoprenylcysteine carboxylmethyltransferase family protein [Alphaproteobacteria bacterium]|nr:isoprenylcysteine carboxylmethyltransferase family protein [Alphaproteobacteria bacterium]
MASTALLAQPIGAPGLIFMSVGGILFFAMLIRTSLAAGASGSGGRRSGLSRIGIALQMLGIACVGFGPTRLTLSATSPASIATAAVVATLMALAIFLFVAATRAMGANWSIAARMREDHQLVTTGVFARLRHPIYAGMAAFFLALAAALGHEAQLIAGIPLFVLGTALRVRVEERLLRDRFGAAYEAYAARVARFVPGIA